MGQIDRGKLLKGLESQTKGIVYRQWEPLKVLEQERYFKSINLAVVGWTGWR